MMFDRTVREAPPKDDASESARRPFPHPPLSDNLAGGMERIAWLMDRALKVPGTNVRVGLDAILGLLPIGGDIMTGCVQAGLVLVAISKYKVPKTVAARMAANVLLDVGIGAIPFLGDLFDVFFKANTRNLRLLEPYKAAGQGARFVPASNVRTLDSGHATPEVKLKKLPLGGTSWRLILPIGLAFVAALSLMVVGLVTVVRWLL